MTPRRRAAEAFAELDLIDRRCLISVGRDPADVARKDKALGHLARAMDDEFGPLDRNDIGIIDWTDRQDDIGSELADREDRP